MNPTAEPIAASLNPVVVASSGLSYLWANRVAFLKVVAIPAIALGVATGYMPHPANPGDVDPTATLVAALAGMLGLLVGLSFTVSWRRHLLLGTKPGIIYFDAPYWNYFGTFLLLSLVYGLIATVCYIPASIVVAPLLSKMVVLPPGGVAGNDIPKIDPSLVSDGQWVVITILLVMPLVPPFWWMIRRIIVLSARAAGDMEMTWKQASTLMRGKVLGYCGAWFLTCALFLLVEVAGYALIYRSGAGILPMPLNIAVSIAYQFAAFAVMACASYVSATYYSHLTGRVHDEPVFL